MYMQSICAFCCWLEGKKLTFWVTSEGKESKSCHRLCPAGKIRSSIPVQISSDQNQTTHKHSRCQTQPQSFLLAGLTRCDHRPQSCNYRREKWSELSRSFFPLPFFKSSLSSLLLFPKLNSRFTSGGWDLIRPSIPSVSVGALGIMNTRLRLQPWSDPCLKSTKSQQAMEAEIANYKEGTQVVQLWIKALYVCWDWSLLFLSSFGLLSILYFPLAWIQQITSDLSFSW